MNVFSGRSLLSGCVAVSIAGAAIGAAQEVPARAPTMHAKPQLLERNQGERRLRRKTSNKLVAAEFLLKLSPSDNSSEHLVVGSEDLAPGAVIGQHKHLGMEEIVLVHTGSVHATVGEVEGDVHAGGLVFIPSDTWVTIKNTNDGPSNIVFIFSHPGFDDYLRCISFAPNEKEKDVFLSRDERRNCAQNGHVVFKSLEQGAAASPSN
jgi:quercetin dioxygenase-like cupin family protein